MEKIATRLVDRLIMDSYLLQENRDMYIYVFQKKVEQSIGLILLIILALALHVLPETIVFYIPFSMIRRHTGGFHCDTCLGCLCSSIGIYLIFVFWVYPVWMVHIWVMFGMLIFSVLIIILIGATNHPNMAWNKEEYMASKRKSRMNTLLWFGILFVLYIAGMPISYIAFLSFAIVLPAILLVIAKIIRMEVKTDEKREQD